MTRLRQFTRGVSWSWFATLATVAYSLISVPIALRFLSLEQFGLFVLIIQVASYFSLMEMGMSAATARFLVDYKEDRDGGRYGSVIATGIRVFTVQASLVLVVGWAATPWIVDFIDIPVSLVDTATFLLRVLTVTSAATMVFRVYSAVLYANKRLDLIHAFGVIHILLSLALLTLVLELGGGLTGLSWLFVGQALVGIALPITACRCLNLLPSRGHWGAPSIQGFRELFGFGKDVFLVNTANQVLEASQIIIISRTMGLTAAATWSVSTKLFTLIYQLITKIEGTAVVFFAEMMVRGEREKLALRFRQVYQLTAAVAIVAGAAVVASNKPFVSLWAEPSLAWSLTLSTLMAVVVFLNSVTRCSGDLIIHTKEIGAFRYIYIAEATVFVILALWLGSRVGFYGVLFACIVCLLCFRGAYTTWRIANYFGQSVFTLCWTWIKRPLCTGFILLPFVVLSFYVGSQSQSSMFQLGAALILVGIPCVTVLFKVALPRDILKEAFMRWHRYKLQKL